MPQFAILPKDQISEGAVVLAAPQKKKPIRFIPETPAQEPIRFTPETPEAVAPTSEPTEEFKPPVQPSMRAADDSFVGQLGRWYEDVSERLRPGTDIEGAFDPEVQEKQKMLGRQIAVAPGLINVARGAARVAGSKDEADTRPYRRRAYQGVSEMAGGAMDVLALPSFSAAPGVKMAAEFAGLSRAEQIAELTRLSEIIAKGGKAAKEAKALIQTFTEGAKLLGPEILKRLPFYMAGGAAAGKVTEKLGASPELQELSELAVPLLADVGQIKVRGRVAEGKRIAAEEARPKPATAAAPVAQPPTEPPSMADLADFPERLPVPKEKPGAAEAGQRAVSQHMRDVGREFREQELGSLADFPQLTPEQAAELEASLNRRPGVPAERPAAPQGVRFTPEAPTPAPEAPGPLFAGKPTAPPISATPVPPVVAKQVAPTRPTAPAGAPPTLSRTGGQPPAGAVALDKAAPLEKATEGVVPQPMSPQEIADLSKAAGRPLNERQADEFRRRQKTPAPVPTEPLATAQPAAPPTAPLAQAAAPSPAPAAPALPAQGKSSPVVEAAAFKPTGAAVQVPTETIATDPKRFQPREGLMEGRTEAIADSMRERGYDPKEPITLWRDPKDGKLYVVAGHHRLEAARRAGIEEVPSYIFEGTEQQAMAEARRSNSKPAPLSAIAEARAFAAEVEEGRSIEEIAKTYGGLKSSHVEDRLALNNLSEQMKTFVRQGMLKENLATALGRAAGKYGLSDGIQQQIFDNVIKVHEITPKELMELIDTAAPKSQAGVQLDFGAVFGSVERGFVDVFMELKAAQRELLSRDRSFSGTIKKVEQMEKKGETVSPSMKRAKNTFIAERKNLEKRIVELSNQLGEAAKPKSLKEQGIDITAKAPERFIPDEPAQTPAEKFAAETKSFEAANEGLGRTLEGERLTAEVNAPSTKRLDVGERPIDESPLFGGEKQKGMFAEKERAPSVDPQDVKAREMYDRDYDSLAGPEQNAVDAAIARKGGAEGTPSMFAGFDPFGAMRNLGNVIAREWGYYKKGGGKEAEAKGKVRAAADMFAGAEAKKEAPGVARKIEQEAASVADQAAKLRSQLTRTEEKRLGQTENIEDFGHYIPEEPSPLYPKGKTYTHWISQAELDRQRAEFVAVGRRVKELRQEAQTTADPMTVRALQVAEENWKHVVKELDKAKTTWGRIGQSQQKGIPDQILLEFAEDMDRLGFSLKGINNVKRRLPVWDGMIEALKAKDPAEFAKYTMDSLRLGLFGPASWTLDFFGNTIAAGAHTIGYIAGDIFTRPGSSSHTLGLLRAVREFGKGTKTVLELPSAEKMELSAFRNRVLSGEALSANEQRRFNELRARDTFRLAPEVEEAFGKTAGGEFVPGFTEKGGAVGRAVDVLQGWPLYAKSLFDTFYKRMFTASELYSMAARKAESMKIPKGAMREQFIEDFAHLSDVEFLGKYQMDPEAFRLARQEAVRVGNQIGFNAQLTPLEEKIAGSRGYQALAETFARWPFQFTRWMARTLGAEPTVWKRVRNGTITGDELAQYFGRAAAGWGGVALVNNIYDDTQFWTKGSGGEVIPTMRYLRDDGTYVRLQGREPIPTALSLVALLKASAALAHGDTEGAEKHWMNFYASLGYSSLPGASLVSGQLKGVLSGLIDSVKQMFAGKISSDQFQRDITNAVNKAIPFQATLGMVEAFLDPVQRRGPGANIPFYSETLPPAIKPTTGEPNQPKQQMVVPGLGPVGPQIPAMGGLAFPGFRVMTDPVESVLLQHGIGTFRPNRAPIAEFPTPEGVPADVREQYERMAGHAVNEAVTALINDPAFWDEDFEDRAQELNATVNTARRQAKEDLLAERGVEPAEKQKPKWIQRIPPRQVRRPNLNP